MERPDSDRTPTEPVALPWHEEGERESKDMFASALIALMAVLAVNGLRSALQGVSGAHLDAAGLALLLIGATLLSWYGPFGIVGLRSSVDRSGLHVRHQGWKLPGIDRRIEFSRPRHLPAEQIGSAEIVTEQKPRQMSAKSMTLRYRGRRLGWTQTTVDRKTTEAVLIEQLGVDLKRPWWLLRCTDCAALVEALELAKSHAEQTDP